MGYRTIDVALLVPPAMLTQAQNWLRKHYGLSVKAVPLIKDTDSAQQAARYYGMLFLATPEQLSALKDLSSKPAFSAAKLRYGVKGRRELRRSLKLELKERGWKVKRDDE